jgi:MFS superfamily sulfate permease-like transporter
VPIWTLTGQLGGMNVAELGFGLAAMALLWLGEQVLPGHPMALFVVATSIVVLSVTALGDLGFTTVGALPQGLPDARWPALRVCNVDGVIPLAFA